MKLRQYWEKKHPVDRTDPEPTDKDQKPPLEFVPGIIVKFCLSEPIGDEKKVKQRIRAAVMEQVSYVDARIGAREYFVRCASPDQARILANAKALGDGTVLTGGEEQEYWKKILKDREEKIKGSVKISSNKKKRGKLRIIKKFNAHKFFEEHDGSEEEDHSTVQ